MDAWKFERFLSVYSENELWCEPAERKNRYYNDHGQLWFAFPWTFGDRFEGSMPDANQDPIAYCDRMAEMLRLSREEAQRRKDAYLRFDTQSLQHCVLNMAQLCGVSCWHANDAESADMWNEFASSPNSLALKTTVGQVEHAISYGANSPRRKAQPTVCSVGYVDHATYFLPADGYRQLLGVIRSDYSYENEVRFVAKGPELSRLPFRIVQPLPDDPRKWSEMMTPLSNQEKERIVSDYGRYCEAADSMVKSRGCRGFHLPLHLDNMISEVVLNSECEGGFAEWVANQLNTAGIEKASIRKSEI